MKEAKVKVMDSQFGNFGLARRGFSAKPQAFYDHVAKLGLAPSEYVVLDLLIWHSGSTKNAIPSVASLASRSNQAQSTVKAALKNLAKKGLVKITNRYMANIQTTNHHDLTPLWARVRVLDADHAEPEELERAKAQRAEGAIIANRRKCKAKAATTELTAATTNKPNVPAMSIQQDLREGVIAYLRRAMDGAATPELCVALRARLADGVTDALISEGILKNGLASTTQEQVALVGSFIFASIYRQVEQPTGT